MSARFSLALLSGLSLFLAVSWGAPPVAVPVEGETFPAELLSLDRQGHLGLRCGTAERSVPASELIKWGACVEPGRGPYLVLVDGGLLVADILSADKQSVAADSPAFGEMKISSGIVAGIVFQPPADPRRRDLLIDRVATSERDADRVILANEDEVTGAVQFIRDRKIHIETRIGAVDVDVGRVRALIYGPALPRPQPAAGARFLAGFHDGSLLAATTLSLSEKTVEIATSGTAWTTSPAELVCLQPLGGRAVYLSDLQAADYRSVPFLEMKWPYRTDRCVLGARLRAGGRIYLKGIGVHSAARLTYALAEPYRRFQAELAIDDETGGKGSVGFRVFADRRQVYASPVVRGGQPPVPVSIDITGARRLDLVVDFADRGDELDHADWLDARLVK